MLVEKVTGQRFETALDERITGPLQLSDTASMRSFPFVPGAAGRADLTEYDYSRYIGAGSMVSTADDVHRFFDALLGGELLSPDMLREMTDTVPATTPDGAYAGYDYGLGIYRMSLGKGCGEAWGHDGSLPGSGTLSLHRPDGDAGMTLNVNQNMTAPPATAGAVSES
ncbi:Beta-lactamase [Prauserella sp. Am3]|nr:Beta-lactamase [Prauserella sp. Am3]